MTLLETRAASPVAAPLDPGPHRGRPPRSWLSWWPLAIPVVLAAVLRADQLLQPGYLFGFTSWDDGVYLGQTLRLLSGAMPYRDFPMVEPPGLALLLSPIVEVARLGGTDFALGVTRVLTATFDVANVVLLGILLRHRGRLASTVAMTCMALYPAALASSSTLLLEPYLNFFCLLGVIALFPNGRLTTSRRRLVAGGVLIGIGGTIKIFAIFPLMAIVLFLVWRNRRAMWRVLLGAASGFGLVCLPFFALAPSAFVDDVVYVQVFRTSTGRTPGTFRLDYITGLADLSLSAATVTVLGVGMLVALGAAVILRRRRLSPLEVFCAISSLIGLLAVFVPMSFMDHYPAFVGPYMFVALASVLPRPPTRSRMSASLGLMLVLLGTISLLGDLTAIGASPAPTTEPAPLGLPAGSCVLTDSPAYLIIHDSFTTTPGCPDFVDTFGATMAWDGAKDANVIQRLGFGPVVTRWERLVGHADYFVLSDWPWADLPKTPTFMAWFHHTFVLVGPLPGGGGWLYRHRTPGSR